LARDPDSHAVVEVRAFRVDLCARKSELLQAMVAGWTPPSHILKLISETPLNSARKGFEQSFREPHTRRISRLVSDRIRETAPSDALHESLLAMYESVIAEHARSGVKSDWLAESRAASAFLHDLARKERQRERDTWTLGKASQRVLQMPVIGPVSGRLLRWLIPRP